MSDRTAYAERSERSEPKVASLAGAGLDSARTMAYGPGAENQNGKQPEGQSHQMLSGQIEFNNLGDLYASTFRSALNDQENSMIGAAFSGPALGVSDVILGAAKMTLQMNDIFQDLSDTYFGDGLQGSQRLLKDVQTLSDNFAIVSEPANHAWNVASQHDQGEINSGYGKLETYKQLAGDTINFAAAVGDHLSNLSPAQQIETALRVDTALLFTNLTGSAASIVKESLAEANIGGKASRLLADAKQELKDLAAPGALSTDGQLLKIPESPEAESNVLRMAGRAREHGFAKNLNGLEVTDHLRCELPAAIEYTQNVAFADVMINGVRERLVAVSGEAEITGTVGMPKSLTLANREDLFIGSQSHESDTELKILEAIAQKFGKNAVGEIYMFTEKQPCASCEKVIKTFREEYPGIKLVGEYAHVK